MSTAESFLLSNLQKFLPAIFQSKEQLKWLFPESVAVNMSRMLNDEISETSVNLADSGQKIDCFLSGLTILFFLSQIHD